MPRPIDYVVSRSTRLSVAGVVLGVIGALAVLSVPLWGGPALMRWAVEVICYLLLAQMWNLMAGYGGMMSVGIQAFVGIGGYFVFVFAQHMGLHPFLAIPLGGLAAAVAAVDDVAARVSHARRLFRDRHLGARRKCSASASRTSLCSAAVLAKASR